MFIIFSMFTNSYATFQWHIEVMNLPNHVPSDHRLCIVSEVFCNSLYSRADHVTELASRSWMTMWQAEEGRSCPFLRSSMLEWDIKPTEGRIAHFED